LQLIAGRVYVLPDNGLLSGLLSEPPEEVRAITESRFFEQPVSNTFHGRDIMAPAAVAICRGQLQQLGPLIDAATLVRLPPDRPEVSPGRIVGRVAFLDSFGNAVTNITAEDWAAAGLGDEAQVAWSGGDSQATANSVPLRQTYGDAGKGSAIALFGSQRRLEIAVVGESAGRDLGVKSDDLVTVRG
jgi:S-adenosylmethionine hydrolase